MTKNKKVLITGAAGHLGRILVANLAGRYELRLSDRWRPQEAQFDQLMVADISNLAEISQICKGIDIVVHLAGDPNPDGRWESLLPNNVIGTYHVFEAAFQAGCARLIFASSGHVVSGHPADEPLEGDLSPRPTNLYGATKAWGEALARVYAEKGLSCINLRLGWVRGGDGDLLLPSLPDLGKVLTPPDFTRLIVASIEAREDLLFGVFHGLSDNRWKYVDMDHTCAELAYAPQDDAYQRAFHLPTLIKHLAWRIVRRLLRLIR